MKANELRVGNYLNFEDEPMKFEREDFNYEFVLSSQWEPIPLNEEWLLKFGFEKINIVYDSGRDYGVEYKLKTEEFILVYSDDFSLGIFANNEYDELGMDPDIDLFKYVHQLQNLYFALSGKELEIKE